jgi:hypothetical protein
MDVSRDLIGCKSPSGVGNSKYTVIKSLFADSFIIFIEFTKLSEILCKSSNIALFGLDLVG